MLYFNMKFEKDRRIEHVGAIVGFWLAYLVFTIVLSLILFFLGKKHYSNLTIGLFTLAITLIALLVKRLLK